VHPAKLATDVGFAQLIIVLLTHFVPPLVASALVIRFANFELYRNSRIGAYLIRYMTSIT
jgi:hypothetical protein